MALVNFPLPNVVCGVCTTTTTATKVTFYLSTVTVNTPSVSDRYQKCEKSTLYLVKLLPINVKYLSSKLSSTLCKSISVKVGRQYLVDAMTVEYPV